MFTGIVENLGKVMSFMGHELWIETPYSQIQMGESIAVNGVCLTVSKIKGKQVCFFVSEETLSRTNFQKLSTQISVNLERALTPTTRMGGHFVQGHVDGVGVIKTITTTITSSKTAHALTMELQTPESKKLSQYFVEKGSISLNGVSLTINQVIGSLLYFVLVPHTWENTSFQDSQEGDLLNIEVDILAKYVEKLILSSSNNYNNNNRSSL